MNARHVVSLDLALKLKEAGFPQDTYFGWAIGGPDDRWCIRHEKRWDYGGGPGGSSGEYDQWIAAPLASEVAEQLPNSVGVRRSFDSLWIASEVPWTERRSKAGVFDKTMPDALAALWLALKEAQP